MALWALLAVSLLCHQAAAQTEELGPNYIGDEGKPPLPPTAVLNGKVVELDNLGDLIYLNRSSASLNCADGNMQIDVNFKRPFNGIIYANFDRTSPCTWYGDGGTSYHITLPLRGCGTKQGPARVFTNNMIVRFHPHLEWEGDEVVTIVCRYPPPVAAPPVGLLPFVAPTAATPLAPLQRLGEADIILIICAILFLALLLLGLGFGYACLKKRRISLIKKVPLEAAPSEGYSQMSAPIFDGLKIPRAHAVPLVDDVTSSETLPSDYPSESPSTAHSEVEEPDAVQAPAPLVAAPPVAAGVPNRAYLMTEELLNTTYTDRTVREEVDIHRQPQLIAPAGPAALAAADDQLLTSSDHQLTERALVHHAPAPPTPPPPAPVFSSEFRVQQPPLPPPPPSEPDTVVSQDVIDTADLSMPPPPPPHQPERTTHMVDDRILSTVTETKVYEDIERRRRAVREYYARQQQPPPPDWEVEIRQHPPVERDFPDTASSHWDDSSVGTEVPPLPGLHAPRATFDSLQPPERRPMSPPVQTTGVTSTVDRRLLTTNETLLTTQTDVERRDTSLIRRPPPVPPPVLAPERPEEPIRPTRRQVTPPRRHPPAMDVLIRVLDAPQEFDDRLSVLTEDERATLRELITSETTFRSMVSEARVRDDWERIRRDRRFSAALPPHKWDVVIRVLAPPLPEPAPSEFSETTRAPSEVTELSDVPEPPPEPRIHRYRSRQPAPPPPLPAVHETETRSHVTTRSSYGGDVRSIGEEVVTFHRYPPTDSWSVSDASPPHTQPGTVTSETWTSTYGERPPPEWSTYGDRPPELTTSTTVYHQSQTISGGVTSTVGDREELYSVAETDVDWQQRP